MNQSESLNDVSEKVDDEESFDAATLKERAIEIQEYLKLTRQSDRRGSRDTRISYTNFKHFIEYDGDEAPPTIEYALEDFDRRVKPSSYYPEYTEDELMIEVAFIRPGLDMETKYISWCLDNGFEEVEDLLWAGSWYWEAYGGSIETPKQKRLNRRRKKITEYQSFLDEMQISEENFQNLIYLKQAGNTAFLEQGDLVQAQKYYEDAAKNITIGKFLTGEQRTEAVAVYSNLSECLRRQKKNHEAYAAAGKAILIDPDHTKSLYRRARVGYAIAKIRRGACGLDPFMSEQAIEDLEAIISNDEANETERRNALELKNKIENAM